MIETGLFYAYYALLLLFGLVLSAAFAGVQPSRRAVGSILVLFVLCGLAQAAVFAWSGEEYTWKLYPLIAHLPAGLMLCLRFGTRPVTALAAVTTAYLCCQPSKWFELLVQALTDSDMAGQLARVAALLLVAFEVLAHLAPYISQIYRKDDRSVFIFSSVPVVYYLFDYLMGIYTDLWTSNNRVAAEFLPFFLCVVFLLFCVIYYKEHEEKADAERKEQIIRITVEQQGKEIEAVRKRDFETRILRHDMRLLLDSLALSIEKGDKEVALRILSGFASRVEAAGLHRYCGNDTINYVLSSFESKCREEQVIFSADVGLDKLAVDEILVASILSNALDNALNAQRQLPADRRRIKVMFKSADGKLLLSVRNPFGKRPVFADGLPVSDREGHGYGTQSIRYMTERLGGKCQFTLEDNVFVLRVII